MVANLLTSWPLKGQRSALGFSSRAQHLTPQPSAQKACVLFPAINLLPGGGVGGWLVWVGGEERVSIYTSLICPEVAHFSCHKTTDITRTFSDLGGPF